jgi:signal transduction histidine kinase
MEEEPVDLQKAAESILATYRVLEEQEGFSIRLTRLPEAVLVKGDVHRLEQVLSNLISNAVRYGGERKDVEDAFLLDKGWLRCEVRDKGIGIAPEALDTIWNRYERASARGGRSKVGTGLGLSISKEILEKSGARYGVDSTLGEGSIFWFALPAID